MSDAFQGAEDVEYTVEDRIYTSGKPAAPTLTLADGPCHVCSYYRSTAAAEREALQLELHRIFVQGPKRNRMTEPHRQAAFVLFVASALASIFAVIWLFHAWMSDPEGHPILFVIAFVALACCLSYTMGHLVFAPIGRRIRHGTAEPI